MNEGYAADGVSTNYKITKILNIVIHAHLLVLGDMALLVLV